jgi:hypothetical protein
MVYVPVPYADKDALAVVVVNWLKPLFVVVHATEPPVVNSKRFPPISKYKSPVEVFVPPLVSFSVTTLLVDAAARVTFA